VQLNEDKGEGVGVQSVHKRSAGTDIRMLGVSGVSASGFPYLPPGRIDQRCKSKVTHNNQRNST
jgi:hypothetical protein